MNALLVLLIKHTQETQNRAADQVHSLGLLYTNSSETRIHHQASVAPLSAPSPKDHTMAGSNIVTLLG